MKKIFGILGLGAAIALTACGGSNNTVATSQGESNSSSAESTDLKGGTLNLYTWDGMFPQEVLDDFTKKTGVKINYSKGFQEKEQPTYAVHILLCKGYHQGSYNLGYLFLQNLPVVE